MKKSVPKVFQQPSAKGPSWLRTGTKHTNFSFLGVVFFSFIFLLSGCKFLDEMEEELPKHSDQKFPLIQLPAGYKIEKVAGDLTYPTSVTWDDEGRMYVAEAGGAFFDEPAPARILRREKNGELTVVANLEEKGITPSVVGMVWHQGALYFTHRADDFTGAVSRMTPDGTVTLLFKGFIDSQTDHQLNDIRVGPDGRIYFASGLGGNSAVMGQDMTPFVLKNPTAQATPAKDIVLTGRNFWVPNFTTKDIFGDTVLTGAFVPFGVTTHPGQVIEGVKKPGGAIMSFDPADPEGTLEMYAWGFRNVVGIAWNKQGEMFATQNGYDVTPARPVADEYDPTYRVRKGAWYGVPDFSAALEPLTNPKYQPPGSILAPIYVNGVRQEDKLGFVIDHEASGLTPPDKSLIAGLHPINSSPSKPDVAPDSWGDMAGRLFVPEWGDLAWFTNAKRDDPAGRRIVSINPTTGAVEPFITNNRLGSASDLGAPGQGLERPFDVRFGPDDAMYIVDYGEGLIVLQHIEHGHLPYEWPEHTGAIWKVTKTKK